jgi:hypothetical protein
MVEGTSPLTVIFSGDEVATAVTRKSASVPALAGGERVLLEKLDGLWTLTHVVVDA